MRILQLLSAPVSEAVEQAESTGVSFDGALEVAKFELFGREFLLTESVTVQWVVMIFLAVIFFILGRNLKVKPEGKRQVIAETFVGLFNGLVKDNMGSQYKKYTPYMATILCFSSCLSLSCLFGFKAPTSDISVIAAWGIITFVMVQFNRFKTGGFKNGMKSYAEPVVFMLPMNIISEIANPASQTFRHFGNVLAGVIIGGLIYWAIPNFIGIPPVVIPAVFSLYFDIAQGVLQAFVFTMLTMVYISMSDCTPET